MPASKRKRVSDTSSAANSSSPDYSSLDSDDAASYSSDSDLDASESASAGSAPAVKVANLSFNQVLWGEDDGSDDGAFQRNGKCTKRISCAMKAKCCKQRCKRKLCMSAVVGIITSFWALRKPSQDALLWSLQHPVLAPVADDGDMDDEGSSSSGTEVKETISWYLAGSNWEAWDVLLGNFAMCCLCQVFESAELP